MAKKVLKATHQGVLNIGDNDLQCAVLEDGTRIISRNAIFRAFKRTKRGRAKYETREPNMPSFMDAKNLQPFIDKDLREGLKQIEFRNMSGRITRGFRAEIFPLICDTYLAAREQSALFKSQLPLAAVSEVLVRSLSKIGIVALIDEATGYQYERDRDELNKLLSLYLTEERLKWAKMFPDEFYRQLFRLQGWQYNPLSVRRPRYVGKLTDELVYKKLPSGVLEELKNRNPVIPKTQRRKWKHFQFLSEDWGQPDLKNHLLQLVAVMRAAPSWPIFKRLFARAFPDPNQGEQQELNLLDDSDKKR